MKRATSDSENYEFIDDAAVNTPIQSRYYRIVSPGDFVPETVTIGSIEQTDTGIVIRWVAQPNQSFQVQYRDNLFGIWRTFEERATSDSENYEFIDDDAVNTPIPSRYYRVVVSGDLVPEIATIGSIERTDTGIVIRWIAQRNQSFQVQYRDDLFGVWKTFEEPATSDSENYEFIDEDAINTQTQSRYYRIVAPDEGNN